MLGDCMSNVYLLSIAVIPACLALLSSVAD